jgi:transcriptional regulator of acetoin/glycerol metabolism
MTSQFREHLVRPNLQQKAKKMEKHAAPPRDALSREHILDGLIGNSAPMRLLNEWIGKISRSNSPVLLLGETGTGKEVDQHAAARVPGIGRSTFYRKLKGYATPLLPKDHRTERGAPANGEWT